MKILVDEHIPLITVLALRAAGHDVLDVRGTDREGLDDDGLWHLAQREGRLIVTCDKGFARRRARVHGGMLIVRLRQPSRAGIHQRIIDAIDRFDETEWNGLTVTLRDRVQSIWRAQPR